MHTFLWLTSSVLMSLAVWFFRAPLIYLLHEVFSFLCRSAGETEELERGMVIFYDPSGLPSQGIFWVPWVGFFWDHWEHFWDPVAFSGPSGFHFDPCGFFWIPMGLGRDPWCPLRRTPSAGPPKISLFFFSRHCSRVFVDLVERLLVFFPDCAPCDSIRLLWLCGSRCD